MNNSVLSQAGSVSTNFELPGAEQVVAELLEAEKKAKQTKLRYSFAQLLGTWRLSFITGTKKTRAKAGIMLGSGRYIPKFIKIKISYSANTSTPQVDRGTVENCVECAGIQLTLSGVTKFLDNKNILAFDFTRINIKIFGQTIYKGFIRGGETKEQEFYAQSVGKQAFFAYFLVTDEIIAARGRGGGLALWVKEN